MKIIFFGTEDWEKEHLQAALKGNDLVFLAEHLNQENLAQAKDADIISIFTSSQVTEEALRQMPKLKGIAIRATGFDNVDVQAAKDHGVMVSNVPTYGENTVAEHTFGLMLNLSRKIYKSIHHLRGFDLKGKTLGIVGLGHIGQHVARIANGFEMNVLGFDVNEDKKLAKELGFMYASLEDVLGKSDIITLHVPDNKHTHHVINSGNIGLIKKGAYLINTARGGIIETDALVKALQDGTLAGAGLDVLEGEHEMIEERQLLSPLQTQTADFKTLLEDHVLMEMEQVIITPHNAFNSTEALERILETTVENIQGFIKDKPVNIVK